MLAFIFFAAFVAHHVEVLLYLCLNSFILVLSASCNPKQCPQSFDNKYDKQHQALHFIVGALLVCVLIGVGILSPQKGVNDVKVFIPAQHEEHHHEHLALLQDSVHPHCAYLPQNGLL